MPLRLLLSLTFAGALALQTGSAQTIDLGPITEAEQTAARQPLRTGERMLRKTGIHRALRVSKLGANARIRSEGAYGLRVHVTGFDAADGRLLVRGAGQPASEAVAYTGRGPNEDGEFWSQTVFGAEIVLEFEPGPSGAPLRWSVPEITHSFGAAGFRTEEETKFQLRCALDVNCHAEWNESAKTVALFHFETPEGQSSCSGALVRTKSGSGIPYFLTADHCVADEQTARSVETFWNYQTSTCNGKDPELKGSVRAPVGGARYVVSKGTKEGDFSLIVLNSIPSIARFADYDPSELQLGQAIGSISHPLGSWKRAAFGQVFTPYWTYDNASVFPNDVYYWIQLTKGSAHPGSSGSPLFSRLNTIAGMLSNGPVFGQVDICAQDPKVVGYAKLSLAWPHFQKYLDDPAPSQLTVSPARMDLTVRNGAIEEGVRRVIVVNSTSAEPVPVSVNAGDAWVRVARPQGTAKAGAPFTTEIEFRPEFFQNRSGLLRSRIDVISGNNGRVVPVDADVILLPSEVVVQAKATDTRAENGCRYTVDLSLTERGGIATSLTSLWIEGEDFSGRIAEWFGSNQLAPKGSLKASLQICRPGSLETIRITTAGRDAGSNRSWSDSVLVDVN